MGSSGWRERERGRAIGETGHCPARRENFGLGLAVFVSLLGFGCLDLLGDVAVDPTTTEIAPNKTGGDRDCPDAGMASRDCVVRCEPDVVRCDNGLLQRCNQAGGGWDLVDRCASAALCDASAMMCLPPPCAAGEHRCAEDGALQVCAADRTGFVLERQCTSAAYCSATPGREVCSDVPCQPGRERCNGRQIERCREDRQGYDVVGEPCASAALCLEGNDAEGTRCLTPTCTPGSVICSGALLERCSDDANRYVVISNCGSPESCLAGQQRCAEPGCVAGAQRCVGNVLQRCNTMQTYEPVEVCATAALCNPSAMRCGGTTPVTDPLPDPSVLDGAPYSFVNAVSTAELGLGPMEISVPEQWSDVDRSAWTNGGTVIGPRFVASTDAARFARNFDIPGVYFAATEAAPIDVVARQQEFDQSARCTASSTEPYEDDLYAGTVRTYTNCGITQATTSVLVAVDKEGPRLVTIVIVTMTAERDRQARDAIWASFVAD